MSPPERLAQLLPELLTDTLFRRRGGLDLGQLLEQGPLRRRELRRRPHLHPDVDVATVALAEPGEALAAQAVDRPGLRPRLDLERRNALRRGDLDLGAERRLRERYREVVQQVGAV